MCIGMKQVSYRTTFYNEKEKPPCKITNINEPNFELMAKAFVNLYNMTQKGREIKK